MLIGIDARMYGPAQSGIGNYIKYLTDALFDIDKKNKYILFLREPEFSEYKPPNENVRKVLAPAKWYSWQEQVRLPRIIRQEKVDLMHFPHFNTPILYRRKSVTTIHDIIPFYYPGYKVGKSVLRRVGYRMVFFNSVRRANRVIAVSEHTKKDIQKLTKVNEDKISVTHLGVDQHFFEKVEKSKIKELKERLNITKPVILYVGIWRNHKNVARLVSAFNILKSKYSNDTQLVLAGTPDKAYPEPIKEIEQSVYKHDIITPGFVDEADLASIYRAADILAHPTLYEGNALTCLEAQASGTPVVASNITALPEILGTSAEYCNPKEPEDIARALSKVLSDEKYRNELIEKGNQNTKKYTWQKTAQKTLEIYKNALEV